MSSFPETIPSLQESWKAVEGIGLQHVGILFFKRVFEIAPEAVELFSSFKTIPFEERYDSPALQAHALKVMKTVAVAVSMLDNVPELLPVLRELGKKHVAYGVEEAHYGVIGQALLDTLAVGLGEAFTPALKAAWTELYGIIMKEMLAGANA
ncbi:MAG: hypothetical protein SGPRY_012175 [Prymnesium sp.]